MHNRLNIRQISHFVSFHRLTNLESVRAKISIQYSMQRRGLFYQNFHVLVHVIVSIRIVPSHGLGVYQEDDKR